MIIDHIINGLTFVGPGQPGHGALSAQPIWNALQRDHCLLPRQG